MPLLITDVTRVRRDCPKLPDDLVPGAEVLLYLHANDSFGELDRWLRLSRKFGSYDGPQVFAFAVVYLLSGTNMGIRRFWLAFGSWFKRLGALAGLRALPSQPSVSRALKAVTEAEARTLADNLLLAVPGLEALLSRATVGFRDALGQLWHVFDFDPSNVPFRIRDVADDAARPPAKRRAQAVPGYVGANKRGEQRQRMCALHHAGSGLWFALRWLTDGTTAVQVLRQVLDAARAHLDRLGLTPRSIIRMDGEFGSVSAMVACETRKLRFVVRYARYEMLDRPEVKAALAAARWFVVPRSPSAKSLWAADLGVVTLQPPEADPDSQVPISARIVVTRRPAGDRVDHGVRIEGEQVEMFATNLDAEPWPAADVAALYSGRATVESRFAQEDRELALDRTFSFAPAGQLWFATVGLWLWNLSIARGVNEGETPIVEPSSRDDAPAELPPFAATPPEATAPALGATDGLNRPLSAETSAAAEVVEAPVTPSFSADEPAGAEVQEAPVAPAFSAAELAAWVERLATKHSLHADIHSATLTCPHGRKFSLQYAELDGDSGRLFWASPAESCGCSEHMQPDGTVLSFQKRFSITVPAELAQRAVDHLKTSRRRPRLRETQSPPRPPPKHRPSGTYAGFRPPNAAEPGPLRCQPPAFLPARARASVRAALPLALTITLRRNRTHPLPRHPHAPRATWSERSSYWHYDGTARVTRELTSSAAQPRR